MKSGNEEIEYKIGSGYDLSDLGGGQCSYEKIKCNDAECVAERGTEVINLKRSDGNYFNELAMDGKSPIFELTVKLMRGLVSAKTAKQANEIIKSLKEEASKNDLVASGRSEYITYSRCPFDFESVQKFINREKITSMRKNEYMERFTVNFRNKDGAENRKKFENSKQAMEIAKRYVK